MFRDDPKLVECAGRCGFLISVVAGVEEIPRHLVNYSAGRIFDPVPAELLIPGFGWGEALDQSGRVVAMGPAFECDDQLAPRIIAARLNLLKQRGGTLSA